MSAHTLVTWFERSGRHRMWLARASWLLVALASVALFAAGLPSFVGEFQAQYSADLGISVQRNAAGEIVVVPWDEGPAPRAGLMTHDVLLAVDGEPVPPAAEPTLANLIPAGAPGTPVRLQVRTGDRPPREVTLFRGGANGQDLARLGLPLRAVIGVAVALEVLVALGFLTVAAFLFWRGPDEGIVWLSSLMLIMVFVGAASLSTQALYLAREDWAYWLDAWIALALGGLLLFLLLFPGRRFQPRWLALVMVAWLVWAGAAWFVPQLYFWNRQGAQVVAGTAFWLGLGVGAQVWRYRFVSNRRQRQQTKWIVWGIGVAGAALVAQFAVGQLLAVPAVLFDLVVSPLTRLLQLLIPVTFVFAIFQRRLWEIDLIFNRTLVYGGLSLIIAGVYTLLVGGLGTLLQSQGNFVIALLATGLVAVLFQPLRERLQRSANRLMFGERDDPYAVLSKLGGRLQTTATPEAMLQSVVETVAATLRLPYVAIELADQRGRLAGAATGKPAGETLEQPLRYQSETVGYLVVSQRSPGESFTEREMQLLADIAGQTGAMASSVRLTAALQRSRERLVLAREEERRRIRRDLHDGLGPTLASQTFAFDAILEVLQSEPQQAASLLRRLKAQNQETVAEIRRLVYELRPPALDELGLLGALQAQAARFNLPQGLRIRIGARPDPLPPLSAAVEVAAYRIALEAMTNVVRHAGAHHCEVTLQVVANDPSQLQIDVSDDGVGLPPQAEPGVGLHSMRERAEELGGSFTLTEQSRGMRVTARLPLLKQTE